MDKGIFRGEESQPCKVFAGHWLEVFRKLLEEELAGLEQEVDENGRG